MRFDPEMSWAGDGPPRSPVIITPIGWARAALRAALLLALLGICFPSLLISRPIERAFYGTSRPFTPKITQFTCRVACRIIGFVPQITGSPDRASLAYLANHCSWLDIFVLNACARVTFVAKSEVRAWAGIGWLARGTGTVFIERKRGAAKKQQAQLREGRAIGNPLVIFPEGTSSDAMRVLPFKSSILGGFFTEDTQGSTLQPVTLRYIAPKGQEARFYGWWGDAAFMPNLIEVLAQPRQGPAHVIWHPPLAIADHDRKSLAKAAEAAVREGFTQAGQSAP